MAESSRTAQEVTNRFVILDIETTGANATKDQITEIALLLVDDNKLIGQWQSLINPGIHIPRQIQELTGITDDMVQYAPSFADIANELYELLDDRILVAHSARFDYGFLKNAFAAIAMPFSSKVLCTVRLSRKLYPQYQRHNLDSIIERFNLQCDKRHRAMTDVNVLWQFLQLAKAEHGATKINEAISVIIKKPSIPAYLETELNNIPKTSGVYLFYAENYKLPIYIGKSKSLRQRILSHFNADYRHNKELKLSRSVKHIEWIETAGEMGALLLEASLIKKYLPLYNQRLRRSQSLCCIQISTAAAEQEIKQGMQENTEQSLAKYIELAIITKDPNALLDMQHLIGPYRSKRTAEATLRKLIAEYNLCSKLMGLEKTKGPCFNYQLKKCNGACIGQEPIANYNERLLTAVKQHRLQQWPFEGAIGLIESCHISGREQTHIINQWLYLGTANNPQEIQTILASKHECNFDLDIYKLVANFIANKDVRAEDMVIKF